MQVIVAALSWSWRETEVDPLTGAVRANRRDRGPNGPELAALEHALRLGEKWDARVVAASVAPAASASRSISSASAGATLAATTRTSHFSARRSACSRAASSEEFGPRSRRLARTAPVSGSTSVSRQDQLRAATITRMLPHPLRNTTPSPPAGYVQVMAPSELHT